MERPENKPRAAVPEGVAEQREKRRNSPEGLATVLEQHKKWLDSAQREGARADLSSTELSGANLSGVERYMKRDCGSLAKSLGFRMYRA